MKKIKVIIIFMLIVCNHSIAQNDSLALANLPFSSFLTLSNDSTKLTEYQGSLVVWNRMEKVDSLIKWKLVGLKIKESGHHAGVELLNSSIEGSDYILVDTSLIITSDTLNTNFNLNVSDFRKTRDWSHSDLTTDWTPFQRGNILMISRRDRAIGNMYDYTTVYEYYFEKIE